MEVNNLMIVGGIIILILIILLVVILMIKKEKFSSNSISSIHYLVTADLDKKITASDVVLAITDIQNRVRHRVHFTYTVVGQSSLPPNRNFAFTVIDKHGKKNPVEYYYLAPNDVSAFFKDSSKMILKYIS